MANGTVRFNPLSAVDPGSAAEMVAVAHALVIPDAGGPWRCVLTDWSNPPVPMAWESDMGDGWTLIVDLTADGYAFGVRSTAWKNVRPFRTGTATILEAAQALAEESYNAGPVSE